MLAKNNTSNTRISIPVLLSCALLLTAALQPATAAVKNPLLKTLLNKVETAGHLPACDSRSPRLEKLGDDYYSLDTLVTGATSAKAERRLQKKLQSAYKKLQGNWSGVSVETHCVKNNGESTTKIKHYELQRVSSELDFQHRLVWEGERTLLRLRNGNSKAVAQQVYRDKYLRVDQLQAIDMSNTDRLVMNRRHRFDNATAGGGFTQLRERHDSLTVENNTLIIRSDWFVAGHYTGTETTLLKRSR